jgi:hypothetical protein
MKRRLKVGKDFMICISSLIMSIKLMPKNSRFNRGI